MATNSESSRNITRTSGIHPRMIFVARTTLPHDKEANPRPYLAIKKINNQIIALPLTSLEKRVTENETYKEICIRHKRSEWDYFAISPNTNIYNDSISQPLSSEVHKYSKGWIDLITPMTIGTKNIVTAKRVDEISQVDLEKVIAAHVARMGFQQIGGGGGGNGGCLGIGTRVSNSVLAQGFQKILNITKTLLHASENKEATQGENERRYAEVISICNDLIVTYPPSPPHEAINPLDIPISEIDLHDQLPTRMGSKRRRRRNTKSSGTCNDGQSETRRTDDPNGGGGPNGRGPNGYGHVTSHAESKPRAGKSTGGESKTSAQNASPVHCANRNLAGEWSDADWQLIEYGDGDGDDETSTEEISEEPWQLLDYELSYCDSDSDSYISSSELDGPDVEDWRESLPDPAQTSSTDAAVTVQNNRILMIMRYLDALRTYRRGEEGMLDSRAQDSPDKSLLSSSEIPPETNSSDKSFTSTESSSSEKSLLSNAMGKRPQKTSTTINTTCFKCKKNITTGTHDSKFSVEAFCEKCNSSANVSLLQTPLPLLHQHQSFNEQEDGNVNVQDKYRIGRTFGEGFDKSILKKSPQAVLANNRYSGLVKRVLMQANLKERNVLAESCSKSSAFRFVLREEHTDEQELDKIGNRTIVSSCQSVLEGEHDEDILCFLDGAGYVDLGRDEYGVDCIALRNSAKNELSRVEHDTKTKLPNFPSSALGVRSQFGQISSTNTAGRPSEIGEACQLFDRSRSNTSKSFESGQTDRTQVQRFTSPALQYTTAIQRRCDYLLRLINPAQNSLPPVHTIAKRLLEYVCSIKKISETGGWKDADCLETLQCTIFPKEYLPANSDVLINLLRSYPLTDGDPDIQALARLSLTNDSDLLLERINFALPRTRDDWLATDNVWNQEVVQSTSEQRLLLQQDGMIKWIRFLMSTLGLGEAHTREFMGEQGSSKIEKDLLCLLDSLGANFELAVESGSGKRDGQR
ncbi:uncharacterized protein LAJ45_01771 [Morchella importuna]|uniref:uncharacterized protein n=1 Tax=Morchella importuna TaxID=1174673 RepID=UPI001E8EA9C4|nr:uncharacterized protein LAJ45_01771 [Morchella importuna]KAH8154004.1 hypothetical protein LAJ45_01771 [Morchella importuna]